MENRTTGEQTNERCFGCTCVANIMRGKVSAKLKVEDILDVFFNIFFLHVIAEMEQHCTLGDPSLPAPVR